MAAFEIALRELLRDVVREVVREELRTHATGVPAPTPPDTSRPLSVKEAAAFVGVTVRTLRLWIRERHLPAVRLQRSWRIHRADLERLVGEGTAPGIGEAAKAPTVDGEVRRLLGLDAAARKTAKRNG